MNQQITPESTGVEKKLRILSGIQPSGTPTLGNYIGAMRNWKLLADEYDCLYMIADLHSITVRQDPSKLRQQSIQLFALLLAIGLDPEKNVLFFQSHVPQHTQLSWVLNCFTYMGEMSRMTQFKDKSAKHSDNINCGLFTYPVLMASDILLYQANLVPVGADQTQHLEICRDIATRFNGIYGNVFTVPEGYYPKFGARVMSLQDPARKMSKSDPDDCFISMLDSADNIRRKIKRAVTDSDAEIRFDPENKPGVSNLLAIQSALTGDSLDSVVSSYEGKGYGVLKSTLTDVIINTLSPIQNEFNRYMNDRAYLENVWRNGADHASYLANKTLSKVMKKVGFIAK
ncbi:MAG: tryptophan--tRNA ligase [Clostridia bacterium]|nr:tryptophan--tRNA ligase [Clostridia bacterium]